MAKGTDEPKGSATSELVRVPTGITGFTAIDRRIEGYIAPDSVNLPVALQHVAYGLSFLTTVLAVIFEAEIQALTDGDLRAGAGLVAMVGVTSVAFYAASFVSKRQLERRDGDAADFARRREEQLLAIAKDTAAIVKDASSILREPSVPLSTTLTLSSGVAAACRAAVLVLQQQRPARAADLASSTRDVLDAVEIVIESVLAKAKEDISVNLMSVLADREVEALERHLQGAFGRTYHNPFPSEVDGVLGLRIPWSAFIVATGASTHSTALCVYLRVPETGRDALPGAPYAITRLVDRSASVAHDGYTRLAYDDLPNTTHIREDWIPDPRKRMALQSYFASTKIKAASFLSIVLHDDVAEPSGVVKRVPVGVLNINCSEPDVFTDGVRARLLLDTLRPLLPLLAQIAIWHSEYVVEREDTDEQDRRTA